MKKNIWIIFALIIGVYFVNAFIADKAKREAEQAEIERIERAETNTTLQVANYGGVSSHLFHRRKKSECKNEN